MANLSTLRRTTSFRTADGEFHGFEGVDDKDRLLLRQLHARVELRDFARPTFFRRLPIAAQGFFRLFAWRCRGRCISANCCLTVKTRSGYAAADGQMGQIVHAYLDWSLSGDDGSLREMWPRVKKGIEFAWVPGGWDANRDGVMEGVQHNTYDVEFYGPNPLCGVYYLAACGPAKKWLRARRG